MLGKPLDGLRILIVEDEYLLAQELASQLAEAGATVLEPAICVADALGRIEAEKLDLVLLDIGLGHEMSFPIADQLAAIDVPFVFVSAYQVRTLPDRFADAPFLAKSAALPVLAAQIEWAVASSQVKRMRASAQGRDQTRGRIEISG